MAQRILILGANGFIGSHLVERILADTDWSIDALDLHSHKISPFLGHPRLYFKQGDMTNEQAWIDAHLQASDVVVPLVAIANPALYVADPIKVFALDFEANLPIVRACVTHQKRLIFPSTSEVYGMCPDDAFDELTSPLVLGPIHKQRWIYACAKQMMDRLIFAYGVQHQLNYTLFRPFNWIGPRQDELGSPHPSRAITQFIHDIVQKGAVTLVNGGQQKRTFLDIADGIDGVMRILADTGSTTYQKIYNFGNPDNELSIAAFARELISALAMLPGWEERAHTIQMITTKAEDFYGQSYQDMDRRVPSIAAARKDLAWQPATPLKETLLRTLNYYLNS